MGEKALRVRCKAITKATGEPCKQWAIRGGTVCRKHGGSAPQVKAKAKAAVAAEVFNWGLSDVHADPGETLLRLVAQSAMRVTRLSKELEEAVDEYGLYDTMVGESMGSAEHSTFKTGEYVRALAKLESDERDRLAKFSATAINAGLDKRRVELAEKQGEMMVVMVTAALIEAKVPEQYAAAFKMALASQARALTA